MASKARKQKPAKARKIRQYTKKEVATLKAHALELYRADESHAKELGHALLDVKAALRGTGKGSFEKWWKEHKLSQARVSYCMRLARGKVAEAKTKRSPFKGEHAPVWKSTQKDVNDFLRQCTSPYHPTPREVYVRLAPVVGNLVFNVGRLQGWKMNSLDSPLVQRANENMSRALEGLLKALTADMEANPQAAAASAGR